MVSIVLLSGCAKVTQEGTPCTGPIPSTPLVQDVIIPAGSYGTATAQNYLYSSSNARIVFTGPNNYVMQSTNGQLNLDFSNNNTNYGKYTATAYVNGCASLADTFNVTATLSIPCTVSNPQNLVLSTGLNDYFSYNSSFSSTYYNQSYVIEYYNTASDGTPLSMYFNTSSTPYPNSIYSLDSTGYFNSGSCFVLLGSSPYTAVSVSGKVYIVNMNYKNYIILCDAKFKSSTGAYFTITGGVEYN
jgi:hypothetical protein